MYTDSYVYIYMYTFIYIYTHSYIYNIHISNYIIYYTCTLYTCWSKYVKISLCSSYSTSQTQEASNFGDSLFMTPSVICAQLCWAKRAHLESRGVLTQMPSSLHGPLRHWQTPPVWPERGMVVPILHPYFSKKICGYFTKKGVRGILGGVVFERLKLFPFRPFHLTCLLAVGTNKSPFSFLETIVSKHVAWGIWRLSNLWAIMSWGRANKGE